MTYGVAFHLDRQQGKIPKNVNSCYISADELTEGDIIKSPGGDMWQVLTEPEYTCLGITFNAMWLDVSTPNNLQVVTLDPHQEFELLDYQPHRNVEQVAA